MLERAQQLGGESLTQVNLRFGIVGGIALVFHHFEVEMIERPAHLIEPVLGLDDDLVEAVLDRPQLLLLGERAEEALAAPVAPRAADPGVEHAPAGEVSGDDAPANFTLMMMVGMSDPGLLILPTHRLLSGLPVTGFFSAPVHTAGLYRVSDCGGEQGPCPAPLESDRGRASARRNVYDRLGELVGVPRALGVAYHS